MQCTGQGTRDSAGALQAADPKPTTPRLKFAGSVHESAAAIDCASKRRVAAPSTGSPPSAVSDPRVSSSDKLPAAPLGIETNSIALSASTSTSSSAAATPTSAAISEAILARIASEIALAEGTAKTTKIVARPAGFDGAPGAAVVLVGKAVVGGALRALLGAPVGAADVGAFVGAAVVGAVVGAFVGGFVGRAVVGGSVVARVHPNAQLDASCALAQGVTH
jgi:uncharacterized protein YcfJ